jgi:hypothetical protein
LLVAQLVSRGDIADVLRRWQSGLLTAEQVHSWAEELYSPGHLDFDDREGDDEDSVANEVLSSLDMLNLNLLVVGDVPIYLEFLGTPPGQFAEGYQKFEQALSRIDREERRRRLAHIPFYAPFCGES